MRVDVIGLIGLLVSIGVLVAVLILVTTLVPRLRRSLTMVSKAFVLFRIPCQPCVSATLCRFLSMGENTYTLCES